MLRWLWNKIMKWGWDFNRREEVVSLAPSRMGEPVVRINMSNAINGRVLEIATQQQRNHDWDVEMYIVTEGESLHDALATLLLTKGLK
jgi:hypothetical protein